MRLIWLLVIKFTIIKMNWYHKGKKIASISTATHKLKYLDNAIQRKWTQVHEKNDV